MRLRDLLPWLFLAGCAGDPSPSVDASQDSSPADAPADVGDTGPRPDSRQPVDQAPVEDTAQGMDSTPEDRPFVFPDIPERPRDAGIDTAPDFPDVVIPSEAIIAPFLGRPSRGGAIAVTPDDMVAVAVNRTAGSVSVFALAPGLAPTLTRLRELPVGPGSEPWSVTLGPDGDSALVVLRRARQVVRVQSLHGAPAVATARGATGVEPTSIALSPSGQRVFVANWGDGTLSVLDGRTLATVRTVDLNGALAASGVLGAGATPRPGLAHPRALVVTNNGDGADADEVLYATEFYAQRGNPGATGLERFDRDRQGVVYRVPLATLEPTTHLIAPAPDLGFRDSANAVAGCFPNQLYAIAWSNNRLFVTAECASPRGPIGPVPPAAPAMDAGADAATDARVDAPGDAADAPDVLPPLVPDPAGANFRTEVSAAIYVLDAVTGAEQPTRRVLLNARFQSLYDGRRLADDGASRRMPLVPLDLDFQPGTTTAYVVGYGSDAVFRVRFNTDGSTAEVGLAGAPGFVNLAPGGAIATGQDPVGIAFASAPTQSAYVINEHSRNVSAVSLTRQEVTAAVASAEPPTGDEATRLQGRRLFVTGTGRWSFKGQAWNSCEACHPDGLTDNVTWFFARGPRQTPALDGAYDPRDRTNPRIFNWTAVFDEVSDFELNTRGNSGGVGAVVHRAGTAPPAASDRIVFDGTTPVPPQVATMTPQDGLSGSSESVAFRTGSGSPRTVLDDWEQLTRYIASVRSPVAPGSLAPSEVTAGRALFTTHHCDGCHGGPRWTLSRRFYTPDEATSHRTTGELINRLFDVPVGFPMAVAPAPGRFRLAPFDPGNDQLSCILRRVGTYATGRGVAPMGVDILEVRANGPTPTTPMTVNAQGVTGYNPPSLVGLATTAPYLHAGQARTLEELFSDTFRGHHQAFSPGWTPSAMELRALAAFLLSLDDSAATVPIPTRVTGPMAFDPDICAQFSR
ncbi:MAG: hypothetical protein HY909_23555 [Deltaproteobacteria bacterium]|nr:hypothetical protein [Deltaproteobacteria bacterium]